MNRICRYVIFFFVLCLINACSEQKRLAAYKQNQAILYQPSANIVRPEYMVYHSSDTLSQLYIKIFVNELLFNEANPEHKLMAKARFSYQLTDITNLEDNTAVLDSFSKECEFLYISSKQFVVLTLPVRCNIGKSYRLKVGVYDKLRDIGNTGYIIIDKRNTSSAQNFKLISKENKAPYFTNYIGTDDSIKIQVNKEVSFLYISMQQEKLPLPQPPFSSEAEPTFTFMADSVWKIPYKMSNWYRFPYKGLYFIQNDSVAGEGVYLCNFGNAFPRVIDVKSMVSPIEYLSTTEEFKKLGNDENIKLAVDNFWLSLSSNKEDSRELIRIFYARMHYANLYFTSYKPGWKTDRGMIYMIFGPPSYINKTFDSETWEYYLKQDSKDLLIKFVKTRSLYSDNHFVMQRDASFTPFWREAVYSWRNGKAYSLEE